MSSHPWGRTMLGTTKRLGISVREYLGRPLCALVLVLTASLIGCGDPPVTSTSDPTPEVAYIVGETGPRGGSFEGSFGASRVLGFRYSANANVHVRVILEQLSGDNNPVLAFYGPYSATTGWGDQLDRDAEGVGGNRSLVVGPLPEGLYLAMVTTTNWPATGTYRLSFVCEQGCPSLPVCPPSPSCPTDQVCYSGYELTEDGCPTCDCRDECRNDLDCGPEEACRRGECEERCACPVPYDPVCGADGNTYANRCEAGCAGVVVVSEGECPEVCPELACDLDCPSGYRLGTDGCEICECKEPCEACDLRVEPVCTMSGVTRQNRCLAECRGEQVAYAGPCRTECPDFTCDLNCPGGFASDADGCPVCECLPCPEDLNQVCGADGITYINACAAETAGVDILFASPCPPRCHSNAECPTNYACKGGLLGLTDCDPTTSSCLAFCFLNEIHCETATACPAGDVCNSEGICVSPCDCAPVWDPVCGVDNTDFDNACRARCAETTITATGTCCDQRVITECELECPNGYAVDSDGCELCSCAEPATCVCTDVYNPVCGADGTEYENECRMRCEGVGACSSNEIVSDAPICGEDGNLYTAECFLECAGVNRCPVAISDISNVDSICGEDGVLYPNECSMQCAGVHRAEDQTICR